MERAAGPLVCLIAPNVVVFVLGRFLQGPAMGAVLLTVAITRQVCTPRVGMTAVGVVTTGASILGIPAMFLLSPAIDAFGHRSVFVLAAVMVLNATATDTLVAGVAANSMSGVRLYVLMSGAALVVAAVFATVLVRRRG